MSEEKPDSYTVGPPHWPIKDGIIMKGPHKGKKYVYTETMDGSFMNCKAVFGKERDV